MPAKNKKNSKKIATVTLGNPPMLLLWFVVLGLTFLRLFVACSGSLGESETLLLACSAHPAGGYIEGPCGVPLLCSLLLALKPLFAGSSLLVLRLLSPMAALLLSWCIWSLARKLSPRTPAVAIWSVIAVNLLPWVNLASLVMDGGMVTASLILLGVVAGWNALDSTVVKGKQTRSPFAPWLLFGCTLGVGTLFFYHLGWLLPVAVAVQLRRHGTKSFPWQGVLGTLGFLVLGWLGPLIWNVRHDWIQWSSVAQGFDSYTIDGVSLSIALCVALSALLISLLILLATMGVWWRRGMSLLLPGMGILSLLVFTMPARIPEVFPSPLGVQGVGGVAHAVLSLRQERPDSKGKESFLIAQSSGLAALLGEKIMVNYPECPGAPSVFVAESPSMNSSFALWPSYADAVAPAPKDINYTEDFISPFLGRNALYMTTEAPNELPQTITGAFGAVGLLKEIPLTINGQSQIVRIYQCEAYRSLSL